MGDHAGANAIRLVARVAAEPAQDGGEQGPTPVGESAKPQVYDAKKQGGKKQSGCTVPGPFGQPRLQDASEEELFEKGHDPEESQKNADGFPERGRRGEMHGAERQCQARRSRKEIKIVQQPNPPLAPVGEEAVACFRDGNGLPVTSSKLRNSARRPRMAIGNAG